MGAGDCASDVEAEQGDGDGAGAGFGDSAADETVGGGGGEEEGLQLLITEQDLLDAAERAHIYVTDAADLWQELVAMHRKRSDSS